MKRKSIRKAIQYFSFILFPVTIFYFSPYLIVVAAAQGIISGSLIIFASLFLISLFGGRIFCSYLCPAGAAQDCLSQANGKSVPGGKYNWIKYFIWVPWIGGIILVAIQGGGYKTIDFLYMTSHGISVHDSIGYIIYYGVLVLFSILCLTIGKRAGCHYICWMSPFMILGTRIKNFFKWPSLHLEGDATKCVDCKRCSKACPMSLEIHKMVKAEDMRNDECILCGECIDTCHKNAIKYAFRNVSKKGVIYGNHKHI